METTGSITSNLGSNGVANKVDDLRDSANEQIDKMSSSVKPAVDRFARSAHHVVDKVATAASDAADSLGVRADQLKGAHSQLAEQCEEYVRENPLVSIGIAVAAGYILSKVLSSR